MPNVALDDRDLDRTRPAIDAAFGDKWLRVKPAHEACARVISTLYGDRSQHKNRDGLHPNLHLLAGDEQ
jgi:hypothetical protein